QEKVQLDEEIEPVRLGSIRTHGGFNSAAAQVSSLLQPDWILSTPPLRSGIEFLSFLLPCVGGTANVSQRPGDLFVRLVGTRGLLDPRGSPPTSPAFRLALDIDRTPPTYRSCSGGGNSWLRISYHDMILAWAQVPHFCVYGNRGVGSVGTLEVEAKADASVLREEVEGPIANSRCSNQAEEFGHDEISEGRC
uniref:Uncharacterized protein n=3 Tax=Aegilops tauschii subsp. strangulata TaxID=200361 RepID=A0A453KVL2_AEGTS